MSKDNFNALRAAQSFLLAERQKKGLDHVDE
jgi:hypothetical protein